MTLIDKDAALALIDRKVGKDHPALADELRHAIAALPVAVSGVKPFGWIGGNAACHHAHVNELAEGLQSCTSCGAVRGTALAPSSARDVREAALLAALQWCSGSDDFQEGGKAREGWLKLCAPLLHGETRP